MNLENFKRIISEKKTTISKKHKMENSQGGNWKNKRIISTYLNEKHHGIKWTYLYRSLIWIIHHNDAVGTHHQWCYPGSLSFITLDCLPRLIKLWPVSQTPSATSLNAKWIFLFFKGRETRKKPEQIRPRKLKRLWQVSIWVVERKKKKKKKKKLSEKKQDFPLWYDDGRLKQRVYRKKNR